MAQPDLPSRRVVRVAPLQGLRQYVVAVRGFGRDAHLFLAITAFRGLTVFTLQTILNLYLYSRGYDTPFIGLVNAVNSIATLVFSVPLGYLADRFGRRRVLLAGGLLYPVALLAVSLSTTRVELFVFMFLFGACATSYWVAGVPLLFVVTRESERVQAFSINSFLLYGLGPIGASISGLTVEIAARLLGVSPNSSAALQYGMFLMVVIAVIGSVPYPWLRDPESGRRSTPRQPGPPLRSLAWLFARLLIPDLILAVGIGTILTFVQLYFHLRFGLDPGPVGLVVASGGIAAGFAALVTPLLSRRWGNLRTTVGSQWATVPLMVVMALSTNLILAIPAYWLVLMLRGTSDPVYTAFVQEQVPDAYRARLTGLYGVTYAIGASLGPAVSGQIQKLGGFTPAFITGASCYLLGALCLYAFFGGV